MKKIKLKNQKIEEIDLLNKKTKRNLKKKYK